MKLVLSFATLCLLVAAQAGTLPEVQERGFAQPPTIAENQDLEENVGLGDIEGLGIESGAKGCNNDKKGKGCCNCSRQTNGKCAPVGGKACLQGKCKCKTMGIGPLSM